MKIKRVYVVALLALAMLTVPAFAQSTAREAREERTTAEDLAGARKTRNKNTAAKVLRQRVEEGVDWEEQPLSDVLDWLRDQGDINVVAVWRALPVDEDSPVDLVLNDATVAEILNEVVAQLDEEGNVMYRAREGTIRISHRDDFNRKLEVRVYDVTDLLQQVPNYAESAPQIDMQAAAQASQSGGGGGGGGRGVFTNTGQNIGRQQGQAQQQEQTRRSTSLADIIRQTIEPDTWFDVGGNGRITVYDTALIVRASAEVHEAIAGFFVEGL